MIIEEVKIENIFSHKNSEVKFYNGLNIIVGENGSGKTSILNAIALALFKIKPEGLRLKDIIRIGTKEGKVELKFRIRNKRYLIVRKISNVSSSYLYELNGDSRSLISKDEKTIEKILRNELEINEDVFINSIYIRQGEIPSIIHKPPAERKKILAKILGIENLETAYKEMKRIIDKYTNKLKFLNEYQKEYERLNSEIVKRKKLIEELKEKYDRFKIEYEKKLSEKNIVEERLKDIENKMQLVLKLRELKERMRKLNDEIAFLKEKERFIKENENKYKEYLELKNVYEKLKNEISAIREKVKSEKIFKEELSRKSIELKRISKEILNIRKDVEKFGIRIESLREFRKNLEEKLKEYEEMKNRFLEEIWKIETTINHEEKFIEEIKRMKDRCPICNSKIDEVKKRKILEEKILNVNKLKTRLNELSDNLIKIEKELSNIKTGLDFVSKYSPEYVEMLLKRKNELEEEIDKISKELRKEISEELRIKERELNDLENKLKYLEPVYNRYISSLEVLKEKNLNEILKERERVKREIDEILRNIGSEEEILLKMNELRKRKEAIENELQNILKNISKLEGMISTESENLKYYENRLKEIKEKISEREVLTRFVKFLERVRKIFGKDYLQRKIREQYIPLIERYTKYFFKKFNIPFSDIRLSEDLDIIIIRENGKLPLDSLSGGERISLALSLRLAISRIFASKMELLILDEPTIHLDSNRKYCLINIIKELKDIPQIIIVTHDKEFEQLGENVIEVHKENNISKISQRKFDIY